MEAADDRFNELTREITHLYRCNVSVDEAVKLMRSQGIISELIKSIYDQLLWNDEKLITERFHYYNVEFGTNEYFNAVKCWTSRYLLAYAHLSPQSNPYKIKIIDAFQNKSINLSVKKSGYYITTIYPLKDGFGLMEERRTRINFISLIFLDLRRRNLQKLHTIECSANFIQIFVNESDPTTFLLKDQPTRICKIVDKKISFGETIEIDLNSYSFYYDKCVYVLKRRDENRGGSEISQLYIYDIEEKTKNRFDLEVPVGYTIYEKNFKLIRDSLFFDLISPNNGHFIGCMNVQIRQWNILDFNLKLSSYSIYGYDKCSLIIRTASKHYSEHSIYKIPFGNPDLLENTAWLSLIKTMKKRETDPYEAARKYLPSNSTINCPFDNAD